jgi:hypothetical protein
MPNRFIRRNPYFIILNGNHINPFKNVKSSISQHPVNLCLSRIVVIRAYFFGAHSRDGLYGNKGIAFVLSPSASYDLKR